jgi:hypothetical protein
MPDTGAFGNGFVPADVMKVLLDECVPWPLHRLLIGHECKSAQQSGWGGLKNGDLLGRAEGHFDVFITADKNLRYQQNLATRNLPIVELSTNDLRRIQVAIPLIIAALSSIRPGDYRTIQIP